MFRFLATFLVVATIAVAPVAFGQSEVVVKGVPDQIVTCTGPDCNLESFVVLIQNILNFLVYLAVICAALLFSWAGWLYLTNSQNPGNIEKAKKVFWNVVIGLVIIIGAWLLVDTLLNTLLDKGQFQNWNQL